MAATGARSGDVEIILESGADAVCQRPGELRFRVLDADTEAPLAGLHPRLRYHRAADDLTLERRNFTDLGNGVYTCPFRPSIVGAHALLFAAQVDGHEVAEVFAIEVVPDRVNVTVAGVEYRVGAEWLPGHIHSHPADKVHLVFEIERRQDSGFRHFGADAVSVHVVSAQRGVSETLATAQIGEGRFEAQRAFTPEEVGLSETEYDVHLTFRDPEHGLSVPEGALRFPLAAGPAH
jgi:hypothetical protein